MQNRHGGKKHSRNKIMALFEYAVNPFSEEDDLFGERTICLEELDAPRNFDGRG
jgi:hypothetical protein